MTVSPILQPMTALVLWTFVMWVWMYATRIPAIRASGAGLSPEATLADLNARIAPRVRWKADNYTHLHEQPTVFYAVALALALAGAGAGLNLWLAWLYVAIRVIHSLVQSLGNVVLVRFSVFVAASLALFALSLRAAMAVFGG